MFRKSGSRSILAAGLVMAPVAFAQAPAPPADAPHRTHQVLGTVSFPVTCSPAAQADFNHAMLLQHSFWYEPAGQAFRQVRQTDPDCVMSYWGETLALLLNPFGVTTVANLRAGRALLAEARAKAARSEREAGLIAALGELYGNENPDQHRARMERYEQAMAQLHERFPDDSEIAIQYALSLVMVAPPTDKTYARQIRAAEILEREAQRQPQHPGVVHYLIHTYDTPALANRGVPAAERYAAIAADAPHALHMPSHIFTRVGRWEDSIDTNRRSAETARAREAVFDEIHALDYMVYGYLQTGQLEAARAVLAGLPRFDGWTPPAALFGWGLTAMRARWALERGAWEEAAALDVRMRNIPLVDAIIYFTRAIGAARSGRPDAAAPDVEALRSAVTALQGRDAYWQEQTDILRVAAEGWVAFARGDQAAGLALLRQAADREGRTDKHPVTPGPLMPAREQLGEMLALMGRHAEAQREFEAVQEVEPRRYRAVAGAAQAAEQAGDRIAARRHYEALLVIAARADTARPELVAARAFVAAN